MDRIKILVLSWHPNTSTIALGGFRRTAEILKRCPNNIDMDIIDKEPSYLKNYVNSNIYEYKIPNFIKNLENKFYIFERCFEWIISSFWISYYILKLKNKNYNVVYVPTAELCYFTIPLILIKSLFKKKIILTVQNIDFKGNTNVSFYSELRKDGHSIIYSITILLLFLISRFISISVYNHSNEIITVSNDLKKSLGKHGVKSKINVVTNGIDLEIIKKVPEQDKIYEGIFIGRHHPEKGIFDIIKVWAFVTQRIPNAKLISVGYCDDTTKKKLMHDIHKNGLENNIMLRGVVSEEEKIKLLKQSKVCVFLSYIEGWGLVPIEALACGLPVVAYELPVYKENIKNCEAAFLVPIGDYKSAAEKVIELLSINELFNLSQKSKVFASQFDWNEIAKKEFNVLVNGTV